MLGRLLHGVILTAAFLGRAAVHSEEFSTDPALRGWSVWGDASLYRWEAAEQRLAVTWDSARSNSFFLRPLGTIVSKADDFAFSFDLRVSDIAIGTSSNKPYTFEIAVGLLNLANATGSNFFRGTGQSQTYGVRNTVEFDYFPATANVSATFAPTVISSNVVVKFSDNHPLTLTPDDQFHIALSYTASNQTLRTEVTRNGLPFGLPPTDTIKPLSLAGHPDFRVTHFAVINYSDALQAGSTQFWGSVRAHGVMDNVVITVPEPPPLNLELTRVGPGIQFTFATRTNWQYAVERSTDFQTWTNPSPLIPGHGGNQLWSDASAPTPGAFYRLRATKP